MFFYIFIPFFEKARIVVPSIIFLENQTATVLHSIQEKYLYFNFKETFNNLNRNFQRQNLKKKWGFQDKISESEKKSDGIDSQNKYQKSHFK